MTAEQREIDSRIAIADARIMTNTVSGSTIAEIGSLLGSVARANMLCALMGGRAMTAGELARRADISAQAASEHLGKLTKANVIALQKQGRHRYYSIASAEVAQVIEAATVLASIEIKRHRPTGPRDEALRAARTCYNHLAGRLGVAVADSLRAHGYVILSDGAAMVTDDGLEFLRQDLGIELVARGGGRPLCRACLDWSERRYHLAGSVGSALLNRFLAMGWIARNEQSRAVTVTKQGWRGLADKFKISANQIVGDPRSA